MSKTIVCFDWAYMLSWVVIMALISGIVLGCFPQESKGKEVCNASKPFKKTNNPQDFNVYICNCEKHRKERAKEKKQYQTQKAERKSARPNHLLFTPWSGELAGQGTLP